jgi:hypothetical protein
VPFLLRTIRKSKWYNSEGTPWLVEGELQSDALDDLKTTDNTLSVWSVDDNKEKLERIVIAFAANRNSFAQVDYALFDQQILADLNIKSKESPGDTPDEEANKWHIDLVELTASKRFELAMTIMIKGQKERIPQKKIERGILEAVRSKQLNFNKMDANLQTKIRSQI